jgi:hypothetical protein
MVFRRAADSPAIIGIGFYLPDAGTNWNSGTVAAINFFICSNVASSWPGAQTEKNET